MTGTMAALIGLVTILTALAFVWVLSLRLWWSLYAIAAATPGGGSPL